MVTQFDVLRYLYDKYNDEPGSEFARWARTLFDLPVSRASRHKVAKTARVVAMLRSQRVVEGFRLMYTNGLRHIPVVDEHGK